MRSASRAFYLAFFTFTTGSYAQAHDGQSKNTCAIDPGAIVSDACASFSTLDSLSSALSPQLKDVTQNSDFFSYYRLNLYNRECPYWDDSTASCGNIACAVNTIVNEEDIPAIWRMSELSKLEGPKAAHPDRRKQAERGKQKPLQGSLGDDVDESCVVEYDDECDERDYCIPEDAGSPGKGDYVSLIDNPERFTGYAGEHANAVWDSIYRENCFTKPSAAQAPALSNPFGLTSNHGLKGSLVPSFSTYDPDDSCLEKRVFHRIISGMHASISTHICHEYLNQSTGVWSPNLDCYKERLHSYPDRVSNLYFNFALVTRAVAKLEPYLSAYTFCAGDPAEDRLTKQKIVSLASTAAATPNSFDEGLMFRDPDMIDLKADFRARFRNVSRIMDCVGCDKCRLWGKLQTNGYGTALKVLFEFNGESAPAHNSRPLKRTELVALVNTMARLSKSMAALGEFRDMMQTEDVASVVPSVSSLPSAKNSSATVLADRKADVDQPSFVKPKPVKAFAGSPFGVSAGRTSGGVEQRNDKSTDEDQADVSDEIVRDHEYEKLPEPTEWDIAMNELKLVYHTCIWVVKQWWALPGRLWLIGRYELSRLSAWWLGLYVPPPINWEWADPPTLRDEL